MPKYAVACVWKSRSRDLNHIIKHAFGRHACLLLINSEDKIDALPVHAINRITETLDGSFSSVSVEHAENRAFDFQIADRTTIDACISIDTKITRNSFIRECERFGRLPDDYVILPENTPEKTGIDYDAIARWWNDFSRQYNAYTFLAGHIMQNDDDARLLQTLQNCRVDYAVIEIQRGKNNIGKQITCFQIAYIDDAGRLGKYRLTENECIELRNLHADNKFSYGNQLNSVEIAREFMERLAKQFPNHTPKTRITYNIKNRNCSTVVRDALEIGGANPDIISTSLFSSPLSAIHDSRAYRSTLSPTLPAFVHSEIERMSKDDHKYRASPHSPTPKLSEFLRIEQCLANGGFVDEDEVRLAANMRRGHSPFAALGAGLFRSFKSNSESRESLNNSFEAAATY